MASELENCMHVLRVVSILDGERMETIVDAAPAFGVGRGDINGCLGLLAASGLIRLCKGRVRITWSGREKLQRLLEGKLAPEGNSSRSPT
ncbi:hypothetical protein [Aeropyrum pernix]|uniref:hypothetical protein n=1 Tax=Aeropyrum pernix TaxID=56636 RepID=UPI001037426D|nr:hypothetical protein [Aeropyrum pernix]